MIKMIGYSVVLDDHLIIADLHLGKEESMRKKGLLLPFHDFIQMKNNIKKLKEKTNAKKVIINGDLKHEFGEITKTEWKDTLGFLEFLACEFDEIILIKGNHDNILEPIAKKRKVKVIDHKIIRNNLICHGNKVIDTDYSKIDQIIIGHQHPAIKLIDNNRSEFFKCHLIGRYEDCIVHVIPSFSGLSKGSDVLSDKSIIRYADTLDDFIVFIPESPISEKMLDFGKIRIIKSTGHS